ncbi:hypothetical protein FBQ81_06345 [Chloroflexi bacterium CFX6]|nr:hypothetical protein [Chloroflexi bacterium CFX6]
MTIKKHHVAIPLLLSLAILLAACGTADNTPPPAAGSTLVTEYIVVTATPPPATNTPDPCAPENIEAEVHKIHAYMREFDDASTLAGSVMQGVSKGQMPMSELSDAIPNLQRIRRDAENQQTPACLANLKTFQISHMNAVLNSLNAFLAGNQEAFDRSVVAARDQHDRYALELARLLGITVEPAAVVTPEQTPTP